MHPFIKKPLDRSYPSPTATPDGAVWVAVGRDRFCLLDKEDADRYKRNKLVVNDRGYVVVTRNVPGSKGKTKVTKVHREVAGTAMTIYFKDGNPLNLRKSNLTVKGQARGVPVDPGITRTRGGLYFVSGYLNKEGLKEPLSKFVGIYPTFEDAKAARDARTDLSYKFMGRGGKGRKPKKVCRKLGVKTRKRHKCKDLQGAKCASFTAMKTATHSLCSQYED